MIDEIAVFRAISGRPVGELNPAEKLAAVRHLAAKGMTAAQTAEWLDISQRQVVRLRSKAADPALGDITEVGPPEYDREALLAGVVPAASAMAMHVRDDDPRLVWAHLDTLTGDQQKTLIITLAAMVPVNRTPQELLAWTDHLVDDREQVAS